jgi:hypothetical protein
MYNIDIIKDEISWFLFVLIFSLIILGANEARAVTHVTDKATVGSLDLVMVQPDGFKRVDGTSAKADEFLASLVEKFKLKILAVYAEPALWADFVEGLSQLKPRAIPRLAIIAVPSKMEKKSYNQKTATKEMKKYKSWFSLAINTKPLSLLLSDQANKKLKTKLGYDLGFRYLTSENTAKFNETPFSVSFGVLASLDLFGQRTDTFVTATAVSVEDKFVFLAMVEPDQSQKVVESAIADSLVWRDNLTWYNKSDSKEGI